MANNIALYQPKYVTSWALVIGIDDYKNVAPLGYARNDAVGLAKVLQERFGFQPSNITLLTDKAATRKRIMSAFLSYASDPGVGPDDRLIVFFAGHGHTVSGRRGETGFLVPVDGQLGDLASVIRWDELTRSADLISVKHILFLMDACYGGLALTRQSRAPGSMRFLKDMLQRYARQVLTAGKADEVVADGGGPRPGHSIFTGHLLDALEGAAVSPGGVLTASAVMAYVYERVGRDVHSKQTPHYGFLEGDGDFIFDTSPLDALAKDGKADEDLLVKVAPYGISTAGLRESVADRTKELLSAPNNQIRLDDFISDHVRRFLDVTRPELFPLQGIAPSSEEFIKRLGRYNDYTADLETIVSLLARWSEKDQLPLLRRIFGHLGESEKGRAGYAFWISFAWYPCLLLMYAGGIAALSADRYDALAAMLTTRIQRDPHSGKIDSPLLLTVIAESGKLSEGFKWLPGHERHYTPQSEYFFKELQPPLEDLLFLGRQYETVFDRFEMLLALVHVDLANVAWGPVGRFGWKHSSPVSGGSPYNALLTEAERDGANWRPLKAGLFQGKLERFLEAAKAYKETLDKLNWW